MSQQTKLQTPRAAVNRLGSARSGTLHAWRQRLTSFALLPLTFAFVAILVSLVGRDFESARALLGSPCPAILLILFIGAGAWHMALGMQMVIEDYIPGEHAKTLALMTNALFSVAVGLAAVYAVLRLSFT
ncbi:succinate dehydrogenase, hydrophobic membrane anchor protein [uncultured Rhodoblastus sp.]|uniref:succinate dehydrogenase, hydrophobic membrane anchor protein n=1 Tax=uncultured Rhodoblastus sp. TaxID=543037 RepID=UPI0025FE540F|nr:succinate dehydrogenase, hydrophobic membrane anchor protein [uncultured Rhodoblastus sp.]